MKLKISILILILISLMLVPTVNAETQYVYDDEMMQDVQNMMNSVFMALWIALSIIIILIVALIVTCFYLVSTTKKYINKIDKLLYFRKSEQYQNGNWENNNRGYVKY